MAEKQIDRLLNGLIALDSSLAIVAFAFPQFWFQLFHGTPYVDPQGFLRRCAANWAAFALFQIVGRLRWKRDSAWLMVIAGLRLSDIFTDWTYLAFAQDVTSFGWVALLLSSPANLWLGWYFVRKYRETQGVC